MNNITLKKDDFKGLDNVILEIEGKVEFKGVERDFFSPKHYLISRVPDEFTIISNNKIREIKYYHQGESYVIQK
ncbi:hypothetical protein GF352_04710 [archaeon]|nr:hypothetical protein [archaeon]